MDGQRAGGNSFTEERWGNGINNGTPACSIDTASGVGESAGRHSPPGYQMGTGMRAQRTMGMEPDTALDGWCESCEGGYRVSFYIR
jgi:hypothetical protein